MHDTQCPISSGECPSQAGSESVSGAQERKSSPPDGCTAGLESAPLPSSPHHLQHLAHTHRSSHPRHRCSALHAACGAKPTANTTLHTTLQNTFNLHMLGRGHRLHRCAQDGQLPNPGKLQCGTRAYHLTDLHLGKSALFTSALQENIQEQGRPLTSKAPLARIWEGCGDQDDRREG